MKKFVYSLLVTIAVAGTALLLGISLGGTLYDLLAPKPSTPEVCGILIIEENLMQHEPLRTCVQKEGDNFRLYHPGVPGYEDNSMTFYAGVNEIPAVVPRGELQTY